MRQSEVVRLAQAPARNGVNSHLSHDRNAHPCGVEACGMSVVGKAVESDINVVVASQVFLPWLARNDVHSASFNSVRCENIDDVTALAARLAQEAQTGAFHGPQ